MFWQFTGKNCKISDMLNPKLTLYKAGKTKDEKWSFYFEIEQALLI